MPDAPNPFLDDVFSGDLATSPLFKPLYQEQLAELQKTLSQIAPEVASRSRAPGQTVLVTSAKAGAGKSQFLARLSAQLQNHAFFCDVALEDPAQITWVNLFWKTLGSLHQQRDPRGNGTILTSQITRLFADGTRRMIAEGRIPCESPAVAGKWLVDNHRKIFDGTAADNPSVQWFKQEFDSIRPQLAESFGKELGLDSADVAAWLVWMFRYAAAGEAGQSFKERRQFQRDVLNDADFLRDVENDTMAKTALRILGRLTTREAPLAFTFDGLDWFYRDQASAMKLARMIDELGRLVPCSLTIVSVNEDTWRETFMAGLPEAIQDRLTRHSVALPGVPRSDWTAFLATHAEHALGGTRNCDPLGAVIAEQQAEVFLAPRALLRLAAKAWLTQPLASATTRTNGGPDTAPPSKAALVGMLGGLREMISARDQQLEEDDSEETSALPREIYRELAPPSAPYPPLTNGLRSFLARVKSRAEAKEEYLPIAIQPMSAAERPRSWDSVVLHGEPAADDEIESKPISFGRSEASSPWVSARLLELRHEQAQSPSVLTLDFPRIERLLTTAGRLFPAITQGKVAIPGLGDRQALHWRFQQNEAYFGFEPYSSEDYWKKLIGFTASMARRKREQDKTRVKLVVLGHLEDREVFPAWDVEPFHAPDLQFCDNVLLSPSHLANLYAVAQMLEESADENAREELFSQVSGQLDFFWKMVTRSVWTIVSQFATKSA